MYLVIINLFSIYCVTGTCMLLSINSWLRTLLKEVDRHSFAINDIVNSLFFRYLVLKHWSWNEQILCTSETPGELFQFSKLSIIACFILEATWLSLLQELSLLFTCIKIHRNVTSVSPQYICYVVNMSMDYYYCLKDI